MRPLPFSQYLAHKISDPAFCGHFHSYFHGLARRPFVGQPLLVHHHFRRRKVFFLGSYLGSRRFFPYFSVRIFDRTTLVQIWITLPSRRVRDFQAIPTSRIRSLVGHRAFFR